MRLVFILFFFTVSVNAVPLWMSSPAQAEEQARQEKRPLLILFSGTGWCSRCEDLRKKVLSKPAFRKLAEEHFVLCRVRLPKPPLSVNAETLLKRYQADRYPGLPHTVILSPEGYIAGHISGSPGESEYLAELRRFTVPLPDAVKAVRFGTSADLEKALKHGSVNVTDAWNNTPLHEAVKKGDAVLTEYLLKRGADPNLATTGGIVPLHTLYLRNFPEERRKKILGLLLAYKADVNFSDSRSKGQTPFSVMQKHHASEEEIRMALKAGAVPAPVQQQSRCP